MWLSLICANSGVRTAAGVQSVAQGRDIGSGGHLWDLYYDGGQGRFLFYPYRATGSVEVATAPATALPGAWVQVEVRYTASAHQTFSHRDGAHDDLILAVSLALWGAEERRRRTIRAINIPGFGVPRG